MIPYIWRLENSYVLLLTGGIYVFLWPEKWVPPRWNFWGPSNIPWFFLEAFQFQSSEVLCVLQFYLSDYRPPLTCSQILNPLEKHWRHQGIYIAVFLDKGWGIEKDSQVCSIVADAVRTDLFKAGIVNNEDKSVWIPCQRLDWSSITWDIFFFLPEDWPLLQGK